MQPLSYPLKSFVLGIVKPDRLRMVGPWLLRKTLEWQDLLPEIRPLKIRWGWALLLAMVLVLVMGELGPVVSAIVTPP
jgi:hypothetical protein